MTLETSWMVKTFFFSLLFASDVGNWLVCQNPYYHFYVNFRKPLNCQHLFWHYPDIPPRDEGFHDKVFPNISWRDEGFCDNLQRIALPLSSNMPPRLRRWKSKVQFRRKLAYIFNVFRSFPQRKLILASILVLLRCFNIVYAKAGVDWSIVDMD